MLSKIYTHSSVIFIVFRSDGSAQPVFFHLQSVFLNEIQTTGSNFANAYVFLVNEVFLEWQCYFSVTKHTCFHWWAFPRTVHWWHQLSWAASRGRPQRKRSCGFTTHKKKGQTLCFADDTLCLRSAHQYNPPQPRIFRCTSMPLNVQCFVSSGMGFQHKGSYRRKPWEFAVVSSGFGRSMFSM